MEVITDAVYTRVERVCKDFKIKKQGKYYDLYVQSNTLLVANESESFHNLYLEIHELDPTCFLATLGYHGKQLKKKKK